MLFFSAVISRPNLIECPDDRKCFCTTPGREGGCHTSLPDRVLVAGRLYHPLFSGNGSVGRTKAAVARRVILCLLGRYATPGRRLESSDDGGRWLASRVASDHSRGFLPPWAGRGHRPRAGNPGLLAFRHLPFPSHCPAHV